MRINKKKKEPFVSIIICTHNRKKALEKYAFKSIISLNYSNYEVVVIDDASTDGTGELVKKLKNKIKNLRYVKNKKHKSLCYVRNLGIKNSKGEILAFTDDDCFVDENWLKELVKPYLKDKEIMVVGGQSYFKNSNNKYNPSGMIYGCNMSFRKKILKKFNFDNNLKYSHYGDEAELIWRIRDRNYKVAFTEKAVVGHFIEPANYRKRAEIGLPLNCIYIHSKKISLLGFFSDFINYMILKKFEKKRNKSSQSYNCYHSSFIILAKTFNDTQKTGCLFKYEIYFKLLPSLLFEIPIKARIKCLQEKIRFRMGQ